MKLASIEDSPPKVLAPARDGQGAATRWRAAGRRAAVGALCAAIFAGCFAFYRQGNDFPIEYHIDEVGKVNQIIQDHRNYNHPQLLLETTEWAARWLGTPPDHQATVQVGRDISAGFGAATATAAALSGYLCAGFTGLFLAGAAVALCPALFLYSHYMKEDAALAFGIAATLLTGRVYWSTRTWWSEWISLAGLGAACALAASGKYFGIVAVAAAVPLLFWPRQRRWWLIPARPIVFAVAFAAVLALVNHRIFDRFDFRQFLLSRGEQGITLDERFTDSLERETDHALTDHSGVTMDRPNLFFIQATLDYTQWHVRFLAGIFLLMLPLTFSRRTWWDWNLAIFTGIVLAALSGSVIPFYRYALPAVVLVHLMAGLGAAYLLQRLTRRGRWHLIGGLILLELIVAWQLPRCIDYQRQISDDSRERVRQFITREVADGRIARDALMAIDAYTGLGRGIEWYSPRSPLGVRLMQGGRSLGFAADVGSLSYLYHIGVRYVAVCDLAYDRFLSPHTRAAAGNERRFAERQRWYTDLFQTQRLIWRSRAVHPTYAFTNPEIRIYRLVPP